MKSLQDLINPRTIKERRDRIFTWGFDYPGLIRFGGIAMPLSVRQSLHHLTLPSLSSPLLSSSEAGESAWPDGYKKRGPKMT